MEDKTMKKTILFSSALVALVMLASCQKEEFIETPATATGVTEFTATIESTKTTIATDGKVTWTAEDEITVTDAASKSAVYVAASSGSSTTFTLKDGETPVGDGPYKATYGDVTKQKYNATGANCPLTAATSDASSKNLKFSSPYAVLKITAKSSNAEVIKTVVVTYGGKSFSLDCGEGVTLTSAGVDFYVAIEQASKATTLSIAFYTADKMATKTRTGTISLAAKDLLPVTLNSFDWKNLTSTFKAVHNTTDGSLTFYYDDNLHVGDGVLYDNLPFEATGYASWGYDGVRKEIKEVAITESVKYLSGLKSTACMFYNMTIASSISGAKYLNVSNVTNMMAMFWNFGSDKSSTLELAPEVDNWDTGEVENMQNMFMNYGAGPKKFNDVPNVSNWNTRKVTNMSSMFKGFASTSEELECAPKVNGTNWKTDEVTDMSGMFYEYGKASKKLKEAPDVSSWNTQKVKKMGDLFHGYGQNSGNLKDAPKVDNWSTGKVEQMANLFQDYGNGSASFNLDLSKWNLSKITSTSNVFECNPAAFNVTIPAKTDGKSNDTVNWYYGQGGNKGSIIPPTDKTFTPALAGVFSVSDTKKVHFSKGNLWYGPATEGASATFNFEANQYDISSSWDANHVSNFYWSKTASVAYADSYNESGTSASDVFFTDATGFTVGGQTNVWRTLSHDEWKYLFEHHTYKYVSVNNKYGIVIAPDGFSGTIADSYDATAWATAESNGFVFLPNTGFRNNGTGISETDKSCFYWTSTASDVNQYGNPTAYRMFFQWKNSSLDYNFDNKGERQWAIGIRLVTE